MISFLLQLFASLGLPLVAFLLYSHLADSVHTGGNVAGGDAGAADDADTFSRQVQAELEQLGVASAPPSAAPAQSPPPARMAPSPAVAVPPSPVAAEILIAYATQSKNSLALAHKLFSLITAQLHTAPPAAAEDVVCPLVRVMEMREEEVGSKNVCRVDTLLEQNQYALTIFITSTYTDGVAPPRSQAFEAVLKDAFEDHRIPRNTLGRKRFAVFGLGDIAYGEERFNAFAKNLHEWCRGLGAPPFVVPPVYATEAKTQSLFRIFSTALLKWVSRATFHTDGTVTVKKKSEMAVTSPAAVSATEARSCKGGSATVAAANTSVISAAAGGTCGKEGGLCACQQSSQQLCGSSAGGDGDDDCACCKAGTIADGVAASASDDDDDNNSNAENNDMDDVEDLVWDGTDDADFDLNKDPSELPELLYPKLRQNLEKQGYRLVGSHSGVKLCRWTKSMLRGRGGCYKHTFYNINSSQCMEMTPSLACANKCVFCWRHHTNPISRHFRWKQDPPELLIAQGMAGHYQMIKQMRGVPGVTPERLATAMQIRHCALSLVGEPIMYPQINGFCELLHQHRISSFMVTNAQFPEQLRDLTPVVQLYLSIDAPTPEELKRIDRPLFEDYWDRCLSCVKELAKKQQRTVFRLTLVNQYNTENVKAYADLVEMGQPDFIEVKGVTYCGTSSSSTLNMKDNVPRHDEVVDFCKALCAEMASRHPHYRTPQMDKEEEGGGDVIVIPAEERNRPYHVACEHEHSCCVLIALDKFFFDGHWHTWIDYERFYDLVESGRTDFTSLDYAAVTPAWATYNSKEKGFDPQQTRMVRKNARPTTVTASC
ncbi:conserved hypothetical protein [Leishmania major strain Friedlin]|uniref:tRNA 4-demethylwyosine synthase (AdoMet-dependent) n=1 Tax=Leishmania major TaxID=5664 RepID=Q4QJC7_LEIMA|nr:conserved hypothetical protein [Leishmania major strain Friedlin]CAG9568255.1 Flavodoxin/Radical_SAM_superfamily/Wyosine_base_formation_-_putative [Leishmania major strain Friedlin]CAJ01995.1 conserved hypothetical protein [Leishmania major strain Friedlin]|eukprot:XP_001687552.1 conserved hypothetical protein [Leishmania major strain Friedlin]